MGELKAELDSKVTLDNLCNPEIVELSQKLDAFVVTAQLKKEKLLSGRAGTHNSDNNHSKKHNQIIP